MLKWLAGIAGSIIATVGGALILLWITGDLPDGADGGSPTPGGTSTSVTRTPTPDGTAAASPEATPSPTPRSFLEQAAGHYTLHSWTEATRPVTIGARITEGSLDVDRLGTADWKVLLEQTYSADPGRVEMTARGRIQLDSLQISGVPGGEFNSTYYLDAKWGQVGSEVELAVRGWSLGSADDPFTISLDIQSDGTHIFQMRNSRGTFVWVKE